MTPCYYCEADDEVCKTCIHSNTYVDPEIEITKLREQLHWLMATDKGKVLEQRDILREALLHCIAESNNWKALAQEAIASVREKK